MNTRRSRVRSVALSVGGSDSSGGAGVQADAKVFSMAGLHAATALTCITAQRPGRVSGVHPVPPELVESQIEAAAASGVSVVKTGMLFSKPIIAAVERALHRLGAPVVVDPVMVAAGGDPLLRPDALAAMRARIVPLAAIVTPNLHEATLLLERPIGPDDDLADVARDLAVRYGRAFLLKGGHRPGRRIENVFHDGRRARRFVSRRVAGVFDHGAGCLLAAAVGAALALGAAPAEAAAVGVRAAEAAFAGARRVGRLRLPDLLAAWPPP